MEKDLCIAENQNVEIEQATSEANDHIVWSYNRFGLPDDSGNPLVWVENFKITIRSNDEILFDGALLPQRVKTARNEYFYITIRFYDNFNGTPPALVDYVLRISFGCVSNVGFSFTKSHPGIYSNAKRAGVSIRMVGQRC